MIKSPFSSSMRTHLSSLLRTSKYPLPASARRISSSECMCSRKKIFSFRERRCKPLKMMYCGCAHYKPIDPKSFSHGRRWKLFFAECDGSIPWLDLLPTTNKQCEKVNALIRDRTFEKICPEKPVFRNLKGPTCTL